MPKKDKEYIETDARNMIQEFLDIIEKNKHGVNITKLARELDKDRNFISGFLHACLALKLCEIQVMGNSIICYATENGLKYKKKEQITLQITR